jgi:hypothetical protein
LAVLSGKPPPAPKEVEIEIELFEDNFEPVVIFGRMTTQWNRNFQGERIGLNYGALKSVMEMSEVKDLKECFKKVRIMEAEALEMMRPTDGTTT